MTPIALLPRLRLSYRSNPALLIMLPIAFVLVLSGSAAGDAPSAATISVEGLSNLTLTAFTITPNAIHAGTTADFSVTVENRGNLEDALDLNASITNATGDEVYVFNYTTANVTPGSIVTLTTTWNSAGFPEGRHLLTGFPDGLE